MSSATTFFANKVIDHLLRGQAYTPPTTIYLALYETATTDAGGGTEFTGGSYARQACALTAASSGATSNSADITFPNMPGPPKTATHWALHDAVSLGNMLVHGEFISPKTYPAGVTGLVAAGALDIVITGDATTYLANKIIDRMLRNQAHTPPASVYLAAYTTATTAGGGGTEVTGGGYTRSLTAFDAASSSATQNTSDEMLGGNMPACTVTNIAVLDASTGGNMLLHKALSVSKVFDGGETARVPAGALDWNVA